MQLTLLKPSQKLVTALCTPSSIMEKFCVLPTKCICVFYMVLRTNSDYLQTGNQLTDFCN